MGHPVHSVPFTCAVLQASLILLIAKIDFEFSKPFFNIEEILIVGIMFFVIYLRGFSVAID